MKLLRASIQTPECSAWEPGKLLTAPTVRVICHYTHQLHLLLLGCCMQPVCESWHSMWSLIMPVMTNKQSRFSSFHFITEAARLSRSLEINTVCFYRCTDLFRVCVFDNLLAVFYCSESFFFPLLPFQAPAGLTHPNMDDQKCRRGDISCPDWWLSFLLPSPSLCLSSFPPKLPGPLGNLWSTFLMLPEMRSPPLYTKTSLTRTRRTTCFRTNQISQSVTSMMPMPDLASAKISKVKCLLYVGPLTLFKWKVFGDKHLCCVCATQIVVWAPIIKTPKKH